MTLVKLRPALLEFHVVVVNDKLLQHSVSGRCMTQTSTGWV